MLARRREHFWCSSPSRGLDPSLTAAPLRSVPAGREKLKSRCRLGGLGEPRNAPKLCGTVTAMYWLHATVSPFVHGLKKMMFSSAGVMQTPCFLAPSSGRAVPIAMRREERQQGRRGGSRHCSPRPASRTCPGVQLRHLSTSRPWLTLPAEAVFIPASRRTQFSPVYPKPGSTPPPTSPQRGPRPLPAPPRCSTAPRASSQSDCEEGGAKGEAGRARHFVYGVADAKGVPWRRRGGC